MYQQKLRVDVYACAVHIVVTNDLSAFVADLDHQFGGASSVDGSEGFVFAPDMRTYYIAFDEEYLTHNTISHEVFHLTCAICQDRDVAEEEARAWLSGYLSENIYKFIDKKNLVIKKDV